MGKALQSGALLMHFDPSPLSFLNSLTSVWLLTFFQLQRMYLVPLGKKFLLTRLSRVICRNSYEFITSLGQITLLMETRTEPGYLPAANRDMIPTFGTHVQLFNFV